MAKNVGWIKLFRKLIDNRMYFDEPFDKTHAWIDLLLNADSEGQLRVTVKELAKRWKWSTNKVRRYIADITADGMVQIDGTFVGTKGGTILTLVKYKDFQLRQQNDGTKDGTNDGTNQWGKGDLYNIYITRREEEKNTPITLKSNTPKGGAFEEDFSEFWSIYPRKDGRKDALKSYTRARKNGASKDAILSGAKAYVEQCKSQKTEKRYIAMPTTWLNQERWGWDYSEQESFANTQTKESDFERIERLKREGKLNG